MTRRILDALHGARVAQAGAALHAADHADQDRLAGEAAAAGRSEDWFAYDGSCLQPVNSGSSSDSGT
jgi:hypothetical protein